MRCRVQRDQPIRQYRSASETENSEMAIRADPTSAKRSTLILWSVTRPLSQSRPILCFYPTHKLRLSSDGSDVEDFVDILGQPSGARPRFLRPAETRGHWIRSTEQTKRFGCGQGWSRQRSGCIEVAEGRPMIENFGTAS